MKRRCGNFRDLRRQFTELLVTMGFVPRNSVQQAGAAAAPSRTQGCGCEGLVGRTQSKRGGCVRGSVRGAFIPTWSRRRASQATFRGSTPRSGKRPLALNPGLNCRAAVPGTHFQPPSPGFSFHPCVALTSAAMALQKYCSASVIGTA